MATISSRGNLSINKIHEHVKRNIYSPRSGDRSKSFLMFKYFGSKNSEISVDIAARIAAANICYYALQQHTKKVLTLQTKKNNRIVVRPAVMYGSEELGQLRKMTNIS